MITFLFDACTLARRYFEDIGTINVDQICGYPDSVIAIPNLAYAETTSTIITAHNTGLLNEDELENALALLDSEILASRFTKVKVNDKHVFDAVVLLKQHKIIPTGQTGTGKAGIGGADAVYLAVALALTQEARRVGDRLILVTSDGALYQSALDEPELEAFHFWTCQCSSCGHIHIPVKARDNACPACGKLCQPCKFENCDSAFKVNFKEEHQ